MLTLAKNLALPSTVVSETVALVGTRGSGKSYAAGVFGEEVVYNANQLVVLDPVGIWYGLRLAKDGKGLGLPIVVLGGDHADLPLVPTAGELVARLVTERRINVVVDVSPFTLGEMHRFATAFATHLFQLKKSQKSPLHLVLEEAHEFLPQRVGPSEAEMVGAFLRIWKIGRNYGIGGTLVSQRPAEVNKGALNLTERMFCGRLKGPQDRKAITEWARDADADMSALDQLAKLANGELLHWTNAEEQKRGAPAVVHVRFREKRTFDSSKTPEAGDFRPAADLPSLKDMDAIREAMAATVEEAKANDPRALRAKLTELARELELARRAPAQVLSSPPAKTRELIVYRVPDRQPEILAEIERSADLMTMEVESLATNLKAAKDGLKHLHRLTEKVTQAAASAGAAQRVDMLSRQALPPAPPPAPTWSRRPLSPGDLAPKPPTNGDSSIPRGALTILSVLAGSPVEGMTRRQVATQSTQSASGGGFAKNLKILREGGYLEERGKLLVVTAAGRAIAGEEPAPRGREALLQHWYRKLPSGAAEILGLLVQHPEGLTREECGSMLPNPRPTSGGGFAKDLGVLVTRGLLTKTTGDPRHTGKRVALFTVSEMFS